MSGNGSMYKNIVLISQISINVMVPTFVCLALGIWLDRRFGTWFAVPLLILGMAAGARNAFILARKMIRAEEEKRRRQQEREIEEKVKRANEEKIGRNETGEL